MSTDGVFEDVSSPGVILNSRDYEIHTSSTLPNDFRGGIVILCYNHDMLCRYRLLWIKVQNEINVRTFNCEFLRNLALSVCCRITPFATNLFHLYDETGKWLVPLGQLVNVASSDQIPTMFLLRMIWKPKDMLELHKVDPAALLYLYYQCHDDFVYGDVVEKVSSAQKTYESLLGLVIFDMVAFALNSEPKIGLKELKKNYKANQFMSQKILTDIEPTHHFRSLYRMFNTFRINLICRQNLEKHYRDFVGQVASGDGTRCDDGALNVMLSYIKAICDKVAGYFTVTGQLLDKDRKVVIYHPQNEVFIKHLDGSKEKLFEISKLQRYDGISISYSQTTDTERDQTCRLCLYITKPENDWEKIDLDFACTEEAYHFAAAIISLYQSTVNYPCSELTRDELLAPPSVMKLKGTGYHGPLSESAASKLMNIASNRVGNYLLYQSPTDWQRFYLDVWSQMLDANGQQQNHLSNEQIRMRHSILLSEKAFRVTERIDMKTSTKVAQMEVLSYNFLSSQTGLIGHFRSLEVIKEAISPSSKYRAGFPVGMEVEKEAKGSGETSKCLQAHIIPSGELENLQKPDSELGECSATIVRKAVWRQKQIAVKTIKSSVANRLEMERLLQLSGSQYLRLKSQFLMEVYGFSVDNFTQYMLMEYCPHGKLSEFLVRRKVLEKLKRKHLISAQRQMIKGLEFLHSNGSFHGNLKCSNVLVSKFSDQLVVKLADPGLNGISKEELRRSTSLPQEAKVRMDLHSYARSLVEMYSVWTRDAVIVNELPHRPIHCPEELFSSVITKCWSIESHCHLTATDVVKDLTIFEQGFNGGELFLFTTDSISNENSSHSAFHVSDPADTMVIERHFIRYDEKSKGSTLGQGHYGQVFRGMYKGNPCAIKKLLDNHSNNIELDRELEQEFEIMSKLDHESVVKLLGRCRPVRDLEQSEPYLLVMEYMEGGCLLSYLREADWKSKCDSVVCIDWALQIIKGLEYLHGQNVVHRDLACRNILLTKDRKRIKISDFGLSRLLDEGNYYKCSRRQLPIYWLAPESFPILKNPQCNKASDVWSYGVVLWEIFNFGAKPQSAEPYRELDLQNLLNMFRRTPQRLQMPSECPQIIADLVKDCWKFDPAQRPSARDIVHRLL